MILTLGTELIRWRKHRNLSQLALANEANVSQRHISYIENGRSKPSREMLMRLCEAMFIPLRERNSLLALAGFSAAYQETGLDEPVMRPLLDALESMLQTHNPLPALAVDRFWNIVKQNSASNIFFARLFDTEEIKLINRQEGVVNLALLTMHPQGLRQYIKNWDEVYPLFVTRLSNEVNSSGDIEVRQKLASYLKISELATKDLVDLKTGLMPVVPLRLCVDGKELSLFSIISTVGTPQDITADELRVECFYPTDESTRDYFTCASFNAQ